eukprot:Gb_38253 [translate_table: standard]
MVITKQEDKESLIARKAMDIEVSELLYSSKKHRRVAKEPSKWHKHHSKHRKDREKDQDNDEHKHKHKHKHQSHHKQQLKDAKTEMENDVIGSTEARAKAGEKRCGRVCFVMMLLTVKPSKFNFTKVGREEVLFRFEESEEAKVQYIEKGLVLDSSNVIVINVSPIEYGHALLVSCVLDGLPQSIDHDSFLLSLHMTAEAGNTSFRLGYNSLGAFVTINHLHFQAYYMALQCPVERAPSKRVPWKFEKTGVKIFELCDCPMRGIVFEGGNTLEDLSIVVANSCVCLQVNNIPYNVLIADCGKRIFLFPRCYAERQVLGEVSQEIIDTQINPAVWEISGHMVLKSKQDYEMASEGMPCSPVMQLFSIYFKAFVAATMYLLHIAHSIGLEVEHIDERNMCWSTPPDCKWKVQEGNVCVASFDWTGSGICKYVERLKESATKVVVAVLGDLAYTLGASYVGRNLDC